MDPRRQSTSAFSSTHGTSNARLSVGSDRSHQWTPHDRPTNTYELALTIMVTTDQIALNSWMLRAEELINIFEGQHEPHLAIEIMFLLTARKNVATRVAIALEKYIRKNLVRDFDFLLSLNLVLDSIPLDELQPASHQYLFNCFLALTSNIVRDTYTCDEHRLTVVACMMESFIDSKISCTFDPSYVDCMSALQSLANNEKDMSLSSAASLIEELIKRIHQPITAGGNPRLSTSSSIHPATTRTSISRTSISSISPFTFGEQNVARRMSSMFSSRSRDMSQPAEWYTLYSEVRDAYFLQPDRFLEILISKETGKEWEKKAKNFREGIMFFYANLLRFFIRVYNRTNNESARGLIQQITLRNYYRTYEPMKKFFFIHLEPLTRHPDEFSRKIFSQAITPYADARNSVKVHYPEQFSQSKYQSINALKDQFNFDMFQGSKDQGQVVMDFVYTLRDYIVKARNYTHFSDTCAERYKEISVGGSPHPQTPSHSLDWKERISRFIGSKSLKYLIIGGPTGIGKTTLATSLFLQELTNWNESNHFPVYFNSSAKTFLRGEEFPLYDEAWFHPFKYHLYLPDQCILQKPLIYWCQSNFKTLFLVDGITSKDITEDNFFAKYSTSQWAESKFIFFVRSDSQEQFASMTDRFVFAPSTQQASPLIETTDHLYIPPFSTEETMKYFESQIVARQGVEYGSNGFQAVFDSLSKSPYCSRFFDSPFRMNVVSSLPGSLLSGPHTRETYLIEQYIRAELANYITQDLPEESSIENIQEMVDTFFQYHQDVAYLMFQDNRAPIYSDKSEKASMSEVNGNFQKYFSSDILQQSTANIDSFIIQADHSTFLFQAFVWHFFVASKISKMIVAGDLACLLNPLPEQVLDYLSKMAFGGSQLRTKILEALQSPTTRRDKIGPVLLLILAHSKIPISDINLAGMDFGKLDLDHYSFENVNLSNSSAASRFTRMYLKGCNLNSFRFTLASMDWIPALPASPNARYAVVDELGDTIYTAGLTSYSKAKVMDVSKKDTPVDYMITSMAYSANLNNPGLVLGSSDGKIHLINQKGKDVLLLPEEDSLVVTLNFVDVEQSRPVMIIGREDGTLSLWDVNNHRSPKVIHAHKKQINASSFYRDDSDGVFVVSGGSDCYAKVYQLTGEHVFDLPHEKEVLSVATYYEKQSAKWIITGCSDGTIFVWDVQTKTRIKHFNIPSNRVHSLVAFTTPNSKAPLLAAGGSCGAVIVWNLHTNECVASYSNHSEPVLHLATFKRPNKSQYLYSLSADETVQMIDLSQIPCTLSESTILGSVYSLHFQKVHGKDYLLTGSFDAKTRLWDVASRTYLGSFPSKTSSVIHTSTAYLNGFAYVVSVGADTAITLHPLDSFGANESREIPIESCVVSCFRLDRNDDKAFIVTTHIDNSVNIHDLESGDQSYSTVVNGNLITSVTAFYDQSNSEIIVCGCADGSIKVLSAKDVDEPEQASVEICDTSILGLKILPFETDNVKLLIVSSKGTVTSLDLSTLEFDWTVDVASQGLGRVVCANVLQNDAPAKDGEVRPDDMFAVIGHEDGFISLWNAETGAFVKKVMAHQHQIRTIEPYILTTSSPNSLLLATGAADGSFRIWTVSRDQKQELQVRLYWSEHNTTFIDATTIENANLLDYQRKFWLQKKDWNPDTRSGSSGRIIRQVDISLENCYFQTHQNSCAGLFEMGVRYEYGIGLQQDARLARLFYEKAKEMGSVDAHVALASKDIFSTDAVVREKALGDIKELAETGQKDAVSILLLVTPTPHQKDRDE